VARTPTRIGRYDLLTTLAVGGMGRIYLGRTTGLGGFARKVVIKTLEVPVDADSDPAITMFLDEARLLGLLHHQHIASVFEVARDDDGRHYMVLDYIEGVSAHDVWERAAKFGAALPLDFTMTVVSAAANGLHYTHTRKDVDGTPLGIVHRDVTPSNVMIGHDGAVKLIDFGIAMAENRKTRTQTGLVKGKVSYLSPEQVLGHDVDARTDVFALGILLYELSTLERAFRETTDLATMQRIKLGKVTPPSQLVRDYPPELEFIVMKALQVEPRDRFADAEAMRRAIEALGHRLHFVLGDAAVIEVMAQLYEAPGPGASQGPASRASEPELEWVESEADLTVRRDPAELIAAMRAETANIEIGAPLTNLPSTPVPTPHVRPRKLRAATEAADALIDRSSDAFSTASVPTMIVQKPVADKPVADKPVADKPAADKPVVHKLVIESGEGEKAVGEKPAGEKPVAPKVVMVGKPARPTAIVAKPKIGDNLISARTRRSTRLRWIGAAALLAVLGGAGYVVVQGSWSAAAGSASPPAPPPVAARTPVAPLASPKPVPAPPPPPAPPPAPTKVHVRIVTHPSDVTVLLDGKKLGHTPLDETVAADPGKHVIKLRRRGYVSQVLDVALDADVTQELTLAAQK
jgi:eukaryotic-like serine/threonine-protein kinase